MILSLAPEREIDPRCGPMRRFARGRRQALKQLAPDILPFAPIAKCPLRAYDLPVHMYPGARSYATDDFQDMEQVSQKPFFGIAGHDNLASHPEPQARHKYPRGRRKLKPQHLTDAKSEPVPKLPPAILCRGVAFVAIHVGRDGA